MAFSGLSVGMDGIIGSFYNVMPETFQRIYRYAQDGNMAAATRLQHVATEIILEAIQYEMIPLLHDMISGKAPMWVIPAGPSLRVPQSRRPPSKPNAVTSEPNTKCSLTKFGFFSVFEGCFGMKPVKK